MLRAKAPDATIIVTAIFPRNDNMAVMPTINKINRNLVEAGRRQEDPLSEYQQQARRSRRQAVRRHDEPRQTAPHGQGVSGLGRRVEADLHGLLGPPAPKITRRRRPAILPRFAKCRTARVFSEDRSPGVGVVTRRQLLH